MELWDAYDKDFNKQDGIVLVRGGDIPKGLFHLVCDVIVRHTDGEYLLMQRDIRKHFGGMWEATAGGAALQGENPLECASRELHEETGISSTDLVEVGHVLGEDVIYVEFLCESNCDKDCIALQEGETSAYKWVNRDDLLRMKKSELVTDRIQVFIDELQK